MEFVVAAGIFGPEVLWGTFGLLGGATAYMMFAPEPEKSTPENSDDEPLLPQEKPKRKKAPFDCLIKPQVAPSSVTPLFEADGPLERKPRVSIALDS
jgi:hypothetical protein